MKNSRLKRDGRVIFLCLHEISFGDCLKDKVKIYVSSFRIAGSHVDKDKICSYCGPQHRDKAISQQLRHSHDSSCFLSEDQLRIVDTAVEICKENNLEYEVIDTENLNFLSKMKLFFKGIRAPTVAFGGKRIEGMPTKEDLKALIDWYP